MNILFVINDSYTDQCMVTMNSLFRNNPGKHCIYIYSPKLSQNNQNRLATFANSNGAELLCTVKTEIGFDFSKMATADWDPIVYYKLLGMFDIKDCERVLYLDCDIIVDSDLSDFYNTEFLDSYAVVVEDAGIPQIMLDYRFHLNRIGVRDKEEYFNAGVMLLNLSLIQSVFSLESLVDKYERYHSSFRFNEQDLLNMIWNGRLVYADSKYNRMSTDYRYRKKIDEDRDVAIYHYTKNKPWKRQDEIKQDEHNYQWCLNKYLEYCDIDEVGEIRKLVSDANPMDTTELNIAIEKSKMGFNPYSFSRWVENDEDGGTWTKCILGKSLYEYAGEQERANVRREELINFFFYLIQKGSCGLEGFVKDNNIKNMAVYGTGKVYEAIKPELVELESIVDIRYLIDKNKKGNKEFLGRKNVNIIGIEDMLSEDPVDIILVTAVGFYDAIKKTIDQMKLGIRLVDIEYILFYDRERNA